MKNLTVALVLDEREGMMIFGKRQSRDRVLIADFVSSMGDTPIYISPFSKDTYYITNFIYRQIQ